AEEPLGGGVELENRPVRVGRDRRVERRVDDRRLPALARLHLALRPVARRDVPGPEVQRLLRGYEVDPVPGVPLWVVLLELERLSGRRRLQARRRERGAALVDELPEHPALERGGGAPGDRLGGPV